MDNDELCRFKRDSDKKPEWQHIRFKWRQLVEKTKRYVCHLCPWLVTEMC